MAVAAVPNPDPADDVVVVNVNQLTLGDLEQIEDLTGRNVVAELTKGAPTARTLAALVYVVKRRSDPSITMDDVRRLDLSQFRIEAPADPKEPAG